MVDQANSLATKFASEMTQQIVASLEDAKTVAAGLVGLGGEDPIPEWFRANYPALFDVQPDIEVATVTNSEEPPDTGPAAPVPNLDQRVKSKSGLSVAKKIVQAVDSEPDRWWDYDEIMTYWADLGDPIPAKARIRTAVSNWKSQGVKNRSAIVGDGGKVRAFRKMSEQESVKSQIHPTLAEALDATLKEVGAQWAGS